MISALLLAAALPKFGAGLGIIASLLFLALGQVGEGAAPAPAAGGGEPAPTEQPDKAAAAGGEKPAEEKKPRTIDDDLEDVLKKHGGYEYAKGKKLDSAANLKRMLGRVTGVDSAASEAVKVRQGEAARAEKIANLEKLPPRERAKALEELGIPKKLIREAIEEEILAEDDKRKSEEGMTERERQLARQLDEQSTELSKSRAEAEKTAAAQKEQAFLADSEKMYNEMVDASTKAFELAGIPKGSPELVLALLPVLAERIDRNKRLGLDIDPVELAEVATQERTKIVNEWNAARPLEDLSASLEAIQTTEDDPHRPGRKMTRLRQLLVHEAAKLRAQVTGGQPTPASSRIPSQQNGSSQTLAEKMAAARTFGGGSR